MLPLLFRNSTILMGSVIILVMSFLAATDDALPLLLDTLAFNHENRRNPKFIIPSLLAHMYQKSDGDSVMNTILSRPFAKKVSKETDSNKKENMGIGVEHRPIIGNQKREHMNQPKTKSPYVKLRESLVSQGDETKGIKDVEGRQNDDNDGPIEVKKGFSGLNRKWYGESPLVYAPPMPFPNSYVMPYHQMVNSPRLSYHEARPPDLMENFYLQGSPGVPLKSRIGHSVLADRLNSGDMNRDGIYSEDAPKMSNSQRSTQGEEAKELDQQQTDSVNNNVVAQEKKFVITNVTKYVLDFYCPHCGGEISVSRAKNRGLLNKGDDITVNKGLYSTYLNKLEDTKNRIFFPNRTKTRD
uniref:Reaction center protein H chain n=1 Tax=Lygus hesperus TaxID=30085 RepID=A0A0A9YZ82_LYGHE